MTFAYNFKFLIMKWRYSSRVEAYIFNSCHIHSFLPALEIMSGLI